MKSSFYALRRSGGLSVGYIRALVDRLNYWNKYNMKDTILISGAPRTGTTWLMEILCSIPEYRSIFEPLHPTWYPEVKNIGLTSGIYLNKHTSNHLLRNYLQKVFLGKINTLNAHYPLNLNTILQRKNSTKILVKFVRANRFLPWISKNFEVRRMIFLKRHPCAVICSQFETGITGYNDSTGHSYIPSNKIIMNEINNINIFDESIAKYVSDVSDSIGKLSIIWAIDHYVPFSNNKSPPWITIKYENLVLNGKREIYNLFNDLSELKHADRAIKNLKKPSLMTFGNKKQENIDLKRQLNKWKYKLSKKQINRIQETLSWFNIYFDDENYWLD